MAFPDIRIDLWVLVTWIFASGFHVLQFAFRYKESSLLKWSTPIFMIMNTSLFAFCITFDNNILTTAIKAFSLFYTMSNKYATVIALWPLLKGKPVIPCVAYAIELRLTVAGLFAKLKYDLEVPWASATIIYHGLYIYIYVYVVAAVGDMGKILSQFPSPPSPLQGEDIGRPTPTHSASSFKEADIPQYRPTPTHTASFFEEDDIPQSRFRKWARERADSHANKFLVFFVFQIVAFMVSLGLLIVGIVLHTPVFAYTGISAGESDKDWSI
ncbi:hypothetical protein F5Y06DRAFT_305445 [Hypoxylon sp. FL0890]|nr:hypothetical protein F5Y06DRAFT_305445 [Hypoxylon sp. FL0890]